LFAAIHIHGAAAASPPDRLDVVPPVAFCPAGEYSAFAVLIIGPYVPGYTLPPNPTLTLLGMPCRLAVNRSCSQLGMFCAMDEGVLLAAPLPPSPSIILLATDPATAATIGTQAIV
jgi:hypothetical protein